MCNAKITVELLVLPTDVLVQLLELAKNSRPLDVADGASMLEEPVEVRLYLLSFEAGPRPPIHVKHVVVYVLKFLTLSSMDNLFIDNGSFSSFTPKALKITQMQTLGISCLQMGHSFWPHSTLILVEHSEHTWWLHSPTAKILQRLRHTGQ